MNDVEFIDAIKARLLANGWQTGRIGTCEGPNCILGAAGFVAHPDLVVDEVGINPIAIGDQILMSDPENGVDYADVPGMKRLAIILDMTTTRVFSMNDGSRDVEAVFATVDGIMAAREAK
jgi:hypothetical protein